VSRKVSRDATDVDTIVYAGAQGFYTSSTLAGTGQFGRITISTAGCSAATTKILDGYPAAHGMAFDPYSGDLLLFGANMISQFRPSTGKVVGELVFGANTCTGTDGAPCNVLGSLSVGDQFDQGPLTALAMSLLLPTVASSRSWTSRSVPTSAIPEPSP
jgi:hypothetical protein